MENIIQELIKIEELAKGVTADMEKDKKDLPELIEEKRKQIEAEIEKTTKEKVRALNDAAYEESGKKVMLISAETQKKFSDLEILFHQNNEQWKQDIFNKVIGR